MNTVLSSISLFTGAGGLDLGMEQAGFTTVAMVEKERDCCRTMLLNRPQLVYSSAPRYIQTVSSAQLLYEAGKTMGLTRSLQPGEVDLVTGGPPCQPFSSAGKRESVNDPRGSLFMDFIRVVREVQPRFFVMENVKGLLSTPTVKGGVKGSSLAVVLEEMHSLGYKVVYNLLDAANYGVPQNRERVIFIGSRDWEEIRFPEPTHTKEQWNTLRTAIAHLPLNAAEFSPYSATRAKYLQLLSAGQNWRHLPDELKAEAMGGAFNSQGGKTSFYRRLAWDKPSPTVTTSPNQKSTDMCHPTELRPLSVRECASIQTFPDDWVFSGTTTSKYKQIGNAVPVQLAAAVGRSLYKLVVSEMVIQ